MQAINTILRGIKSILTKKENLSGYGDFYRVLDVRKRARKEPEDLRQNKNLRFWKYDSIKNFDVDLYDTHKDKRIDAFDDDEAKTINNIKYVKKTASKKDNKFYVRVTVFRPIKFNKEENKFVCLYVPYDVEIDLDNAKNIEYDSDKTHPYSFYIPESYRNQLYTEAVKKDIEYLQNNSNENKDFKKYLKYYDILYKAPRNYVIKWIPYIKSQERDTLDYMIRDIERVDDSVLSGYKDVYIVTDLRTRSKKEPSYVKSLKNFNFVLSKKAYEHEKSKYNENSNYKKLFLQKNGDNFLYEYSFFMPDTKVKGTNQFNGRNVHSYIYVNPDYLKDLSFLDYKGGIEHYVAFISKDDFAKLQDDAIKQEIKHLLKQNENYENQIRNTSSEKFKKWYQDDLKRNLKRIKYLIEYYDLDDSELGKPTIKFEFENNEELKNFLKENKENLIESYIDVDEYQDNRKALKGTEMDIYNCPLSMLDCKGMNPTYSLNTDFSKLVDRAENESMLLGYGFEKATLNTLRNTVLDNYKQVERLAKFLKGENDLQTFFNIWYFLHANIKYGLDADGKEEIRTPARCWADRNKGVDCDCLAVLTASLLINLGYEPKFEIVAMNNNPNYEHIYVVVDGIVIDRVLPNFNERPKNITKTLTMDIPVYQLSGLSGCRKSLDGVSDDILSIKNYDSSVVSDNEKEEDDFSKVVINLNTRANTENLPSSSETETEPSYIFSAVPDADTKKNNNKVALTFFAVFSALSVYALLKK